MAYTTSNKVWAIKPVALSEVENVQGAYWGHPGQRRGGGGYWAPIGPDTLEWSAWSLYLMIAT